MACSDLCRTQSEVYASAREFVRTNHRAWVIYVPELIQYFDGYGAQAAVRRIESSPSFAAQFGRPDDTMITLDHILGPVLAKNDAPSIACNHRSERHESRMRRRGIRYDADVLILLSRPRINRSAIILS